jgi:hypothetical protein
VKQPLRCWIFLMEGGALVRCDVGERSIERYLSAYIHTYHPMHAM